MTLNEGLVGLGLLLVIEGILPFAAPSVWRDSFRRMTEMTRALHPPLSRGNAGVKYTLARPCWAAFFC
jgi:hypothetical protein